MPLLKPLPALLASAAAVAALNGLNIVNSCDIQVHYWQSNNGGPDLGPTIVKPGSTSHVEFVVNPSGGSSIKIGKQNHVEAGVLQFEYTVDASSSSQGLWWDLSDLDGKGNNEVGTPFRADNVRISPTGKGLGLNTCQVLTCVADEVCLASYQLPDDLATRFCPMTAGVMQLDLCADMGEGKESADRKASEGDNHGNDKTAPEQPPPPQEQAAPQEQPAPAAPIAFEVKPSSTSMSSPTPVVPAPPPPTTPTPAPAPPPPVVIVTVTDYVTAWIDPLKKRGLAQHHEPHEKRDVAHLLKHARDGFHAKKGAHFHA